jgi:hypothetical protein
MIFTAQFRGWVALGLFTFFAIAATSAQNCSNPSLADVARATRQEHAAPGHVPGKQLVDEEEDGPDSTGVWRLDACTLTSTCYEVSITLPKSPKWTRLPSESRPVLIPLQNQEADMSHAIRLYAAENLAPANTLDVARRTLLQSWFARPEYFGHEAQLLRDEHLSMNSTSLVVTHFTVAGGAVKYRGVSVLAGAYNDNHGFACVYREEDASAASSVCDAIIKSVDSHMLMDPPRRPAPKYHNPPHYEDDPADSPHDDPPNQDDPE